MQLRTSCFARDGFKRAAERLRVPRPADTGRPAGRGGAAGTLQVDTEADASRLVVAAERTADRERRALADGLRIADRQRTLAVLPARTDADAAIRAAAVRRIDRHVHHRRAHRSLPVDALILLVQARIDAVVELGELVAQRLEAAVGVAVGTGQRLRGGGVGVG